METDTRESRSVQVNDTLDADDVGVGWVSIDGEAVADVRSYDWHAVRNSAKAVNGEAAVRIIRLNNLADAPKSHLVLVVRTHEMKGARCGRITVRSSVVNSVGERQAPS